jgi:hypothetical protein
MICINLDSGIHITLVQHHSHPCHHHHQTASFPDHIHILSWSLALLLQHDIYDTGFFISTSLGYHHQYGYTWNWNWTWLNNTSIFAFSCILLLSWQHYGSIWLHLNLGNTIHNDTSLLIWIPKIINESLHHQHIHQFRIFMHSLAIYYWSSACHPTLPYIWPLRRLDL